MRASQRLELCILVVVRLETFLFVGTRCLRKKSSVKAVMFCGQTLHIQWGIYLHVTPSIKVDYYTSIRMHMQIRFDSHSNSVQIQHQSECNVDQCRVRSVIQEMRCRLQKRDFQSLKVLRMYTCTCSTVMMNPGSISGLRLSSY